MVGYVFPINTQPKTYQVFDTTLNKPVPFTYNGTATVARHQDLQVRRGRRRGQVAPRRCRVAVSLTLSSTTQPEYYQIHLIYWVDPVTGALLNVNETPDDLPAATRPTGAQATGAVRR